MKNDKRMPRSVLLAHMSRSLLMRVALCGFILVALMEILGLLEQTTPILARHLGLRGVLTYAILHLPALMIQALPLSVMIGAIFLLAQMTLNSEIASLRAAGLSTVSLFGLLLPAILGLSFGGIAMNELVAPRTELALARWWNVTDPTPEKTAHSFWFHNGGDIVHVNAFGGGGTTLYGMGVYRRDAAGTLIGSIEAERAEYRPDGWHATQLRTLILQENRVVSATQAEAVILPPKVKPDRILRLAQSYPVLSTFEIEAILHQGAPSSLPKATYRMAMFSPYVLPISLCAMLLLALPVVYIPPRTGTRSPIPIYALAAGFAFVVVHGLIQALGNAGTLPALLATIAAPLLAILLGLAWLLKMEER
ncbi:LptF/LptG family permease [Kozakia baliensis]|uniref:LptF/LptG family permease n=1 Tax=Kozakia baliensis TaxID=153496 RepID=UPI00049704D0|nr:LptF/LptG family permease [Kozakia baliensis]